MNYIFLIAGKGNRLHPLTLKTPKSFYKLDAKTTVLERMLEAINRYDKDARFTVVIGFMGEEIRNRLKRFAYNIEFIYNPFYSLTNSIASLWFARNYLCDETTIINGDIVMDSTLIKEVICKKSERPFVLIDSSIKSNGDYNVQVLDGRVLVMSKNLDNYYGEYAGVTKLDKESSILLKRKIEEMVNSEAYDQWYENALVQMIFDDDFILNYKDISQYNWTEVDCVDDMLLAKKIHQIDKLNGDQLLKW